MRKSSRILAWPDQPGKRRPGGGRPLALVVMPTAFLFFLAAPVSEVFKGPHPGWTRAVVIVSIVLYGASFPLALWFGPTASRLVRALVVLWMLLFPVTLALVMDPGKLVYSTYVIMVALTLLPPVAGLVLGLGTTIALVMLTAETQGVLDLESAVVLVIFTVAVFAVRGFANSTVELRLAREEIAALAVADERARMARELHDVLGHSLTTITVKAGLARRVLESSDDRGPAIAEVHDVERLARQALTDIRATVSGYREVSLPVEIAGAKAALLAAEIVAELPNAVDNVPVHLREPFGYVLREGVTNVIRHSGATRCEVALGESWIEVRDNGRGKSTEDVGGHGLAGLVERLAGVGGEVRSYTPAEGGFVLRAGVPTATERRQVARTVEVEPA